MNGVIVEITVISWLPRENTQTVITCGERVD